MRLSQLPTKPSKTPPAGEGSANAKLLEQGGFVAKLMAGVYSFLPLGVRVLDRINTIIREEMTNVGGIEVLLPALHPKETWTPTGRWETLKDIMYQFKDHSDRWVGLGTTHEEVLAQLLAKHVRSYRDLPFALFQIQEKFRDEPRAKSGLIRCRQFLMKDLYSFHADAADLDAFYERVAASYEKIFSRVGLASMRVEASGGTFTKEFSHEFQVLSEAGEDRLVYCPDRHVAQNAEIATAKTGSPCPTCRTPLTAGKGIEVGNIFKLGTAFSDAFNLTFLDETGKRRPVIMASYGISPTRLMGTLVEVHHDERGIRWPRSVAPFALHLASLDPDSTDRADRVYETLRRIAPVIYDDRDASAGTKLKDADLLGIPWRAVVSRRTADRIEWKSRTDEKAELIPLEEASKRLRAP